MSDCEVWRRAWAGKVRAEEAQSRAQREAAQRLVVEMQVRDAARLGGLMNAYVPQLRHQGKSSASAVASVIRRPTGPTRFPSRCKIHFDQIPRSR